MTPQLKDNMDHGEEDIRKCLNDNKFAEAKTKCDSCMKTHGTLSSLLYLRALSQLKLGDFKKALDDATNGINSKECSSELQKNLVEVQADILWAMGDFGDAVSVVKDYLKSQKGLEEKYSELRSKYKEQYGLEYGHETMILIERFMKWMKKQGAIFSKIRMRFYSPDFRGVHAIEPIYRNEIFLKVPHELIITPKKGRETWLGKKIYDSGIKINWDYLLFIGVFLLLQEKDPNSPWKPYIDVYPKSVSNFPMFYTEEEKNMLVGSPIRAHIDSELKEITEEYNRLVKAVPDFKMFSLMDYMRTKTLVISRIFFVKIHEVSERIMVPLADMFNHHYYDQTKGLM